MRTNNEGCIHLAIAVSMSKSSRRVYFPNTRYIHKLIWMSKVHGKTRKLRIFDAN